MKNIVRITLQTMTVPDDYVLQERNEPAEDLIISEHDGYVFIGAESKGQPVFISTDTNLNGITPLMQFMWWATMGWQGFFIAMPDKIKQWLQWFGTVNGTSVRYANRLMNARHARVQEIDAHQIVFKNWDPELFTEPTRLFSVN